VKHLVNSLLKSYSELKNFIPVEPRCLPYKDEVVKLIDNLRYLLLPGYFGDYNINEVLEEVQYLLKRQLYRLLNRKREWKEKELLDESARIVREFFMQFPKVRASLATDVEAAFYTAPASAGREEVIIAYPGFYAISVYRLAHELYLLDIPMLPRMMTEHAHSITGIDIHPGAEIGDYFFIDHGTGIVIGETTIIGERVKVYQGVTLGALSTRGGQNLRGQKRHPTVEDNVTIYSGASIFGGSTIIGEDSVLGSNVFVTDSVPSGSKFSINDIPRKKQKTLENDAWYFEI
jgi:serine O-acetyltransferase